MTSQQLLVLSLSLAAIGLCLWSAALLWRMWSGQRTGARIEEIVRKRDGAGPAGETGTAAMTADAFFSTSSDAGAGIQDADSQPFIPPGTPRWMDTAWARALLADEDRSLLDQAGIGIQTGGGIYIVSRLILAALLPLLAMMLMDAEGWKALVTAFFGVGLGLMLPKWIVRSKASGRRRQVVLELPLFIDLLRLLQGVGLSIDQSLHILASEFGSVLKVFSTELALANRLYATGRTREQSLQRLTHLSDDDDMTAVVNLLVQVDRYGGAVQEPLAQFAARLREKRQAEFKEKIGAITVKMTGVMVLTLLPALIVITAGPGFMAVIRSLSSMNAG